MNKVTIGVQVELENLLNNHLNRLLIRKQLTQDDCLPLWFNSSYKECSISYVLKDYFESVTKYEYDNGFSKSMPISDYFDKWIKSIDRTVLKRDVQFHSYSFKQSQPRSNTNASNAYNGLCYLFRNIDVTDMDVVQNETIIQSVNEHTTRRRSRVIKHKPIGQSKFKCCSNLKSYYQWRFRNCFCRRCRIRRISKTKTSSYRRSRIRQKPPTPSVANTTTTDPDRRDCAVDKINLQAALRNANLRNPFDFCYAFTVSVLSNDNMVDTKYYDSLKLLLESIMKTFKYSGTKFKLIIPFLSFLS